MLRKKNIQSFLVVVMLALFGFSITPKLALHNLLANHKDASPSSTSAEAQLTSSGFHCDVENLVVEGPFLFKNTIIAFNSPVLFATYQNKSTHNFYSTDYFVSCLRGPPAIAEY